MRGKEKRRILTFPLNVLPNTSGRQKYPNESSNGWTPLMASGSEIDQVFGSCVIRNERAVITRQHPFHKGTGENPSSPPTLVNPLTRYRVVNVSPNIPRVPFAMLMTLSPPNLGGLPLMVSSASETLVDVAVVSNHLAFGSPYSSDSRGGILSLSDGLVVVVVVVVVEEGWELT